MDALPSAFETAVWPKKLVMFSEASMTGASGPWVAGHLRWLKISASQAGKMLSFQGFPRGSSFSLRKSGTFLLKVSELLLPFLDKTYKNAIHQRSAFASTDDVYGCGQDSSLRGPCEVQQVECSGRSSLPTGNTAPPPAAQGSCQGWEAVKATPRRFQMSASVVFKGAHKTGIPLRWRQTVIMGRTRTRLIERRPWFWVTALRRPTGKHAHCCWQHVVWPHRHPSPPPPGHVAGVKVSRGASLLCLTLGRKSEGCLQKRFSWHGESTFSKSPCFLKLSFLVYIHTKPCASSGYIFQEDMLTCTFRLPDFQRPFSRISL